MAYVDMCLYRRMDQGDGSCGTCELSHTIISIGLLPINEGRHLVGFCFVSMCRGVFRSLIGSAYEKSFWRSSFANKLRARRGNQHLKAYASAQAATLIMNNNQAFNLANTDGQQKWLAVH